MKYGKIRIEDGNFIFQTYDDELSAVQRYHLGIQTKRRRRRWGTEAIQYQFTGDHYTKKEKISV
mgnify:CR=1 FL=1